MRGLIAISSFNGNSQDLYKKKWYISATLLFCKIAREVLVGRENYIYNEEKFIFIVGNRFLIGNDGC